ncbi:hypothetical protein K488DRAFT_86690 [Vararia minispora EC-137]|uniref:Uncharacterized protein n=1 Tax=Vararia minispora EC-137 TaxID=1314806 RepID=A0ACB8QJR3_9AGAM|nr:hypothetical protein K488DRAFT_86690 [Vararia minispora EC-137]
MLSIRRGALVPGFQSGFRKVRDAAPAPEHIRLSISIVDSGIVMFPFSDRSVAEMPVPWKDTLVQLPLLLLVSIRRPGLVPADLRIPLPDHQSAPMRRSGF